MSAVPHRFTFHRALILTRGALRAARALILAHQHRDNPSWRPAYPDFWERVADRIARAREAVRPLRVYLRAVGTASAVAFGGRMAASAHEATIEAANALLFTFAPFCGGPHEDPHPAAVYLELESRLEREHAAAVARLVARPAGVDMARSPTTPLPWNGPRLECDPGSRSVTLDGMLLASGLPPAGFAIAQAVAECPAQNLPGPEIRKRPGLRGKNLCRELGSLPATVRRLVRGVKGRGYVLQLPPPVRR